MNLLGAGWLVALLMTFDDVTSVTLHHKIKCGPAFQG